MAAVTKPPAQGTHFANGTRFTGISRLNNSAKGSWLWEREREAGWRSEKKGRGRRERERDGCRTKNDKIRSVCIGSKDIVGFYIKNSGGEGREHTLWRHFTIIKQVIGNFCNSCSGGILFNKAWTNEMADDSLTWACKGSDRTVKYCGTTIFPTFVCQLKEGAATSFMHLGVVWESVNSTQNQIYCL